MVAKKPRIVIIGAGMAGLTAAKNLYTARGWKEGFELCVVEGGTRIGGRINTSEFGGDRIEMGATWIHGIGGSPVHKIAQEINALESEQPWECMDGCSEDPIIAASTTFAEGGLQLKPSLAEPISALFKFLMGFAQGKKNGELGLPLAPSNGLSIGAFLRQGLDAYWKQQQLHQDDDGEELIGCGNWTRKSLEEAVFAMHENTQRTYTSAGDLQTLDYSAESEYIMFPGEEITIAKGYLSIIESLASVLPPGLIQLGKKVTRIEWRPESYGGEEDMENGCSSSTACSRPVKLHFFDGSVLLADHVIITVSLGVLKAGIQQDSGLFDPPLPCFKTEAISRLGFGVVNKLFLQLSPSSHDRKGKGFHKFPYLQMAFHREDSEFRQKKIPWWMRRTASLFPIYENSSVLLSWFAGEEALELESLKDEQIINGVSATVSSFLTKPQKKDNPNSHELLCNGNNDNGSEVKFSKVLKSQWGGDPLFLGSYSYVAVGSSGDDLDKMAEPLPRINGCESSSPPPLQILFAGEATHRTHYSTTHGAYFSGLREANRLLQHYNFIVL